MYTAEVHSEIRAIMWSDMHASNHSNVNMQMSCDVTPLLKIVHILRLHLQTIYLTDVKFLIAHYVSKHFLCMKKISSGICESMHNLWSYMS